MRYHGELVDGIAYGHGTAEEFRTHENMDDPKTVRGTFLRGHFHGICVETKKSGVNTTVWISEWNYSKSME